MDRPPPFLVLLHPACFVWAHHFGHSWSPLPTLSLPSFSVLAIIVLGGTARHLSMSSTPFRRSYSILENIPIFILFDFTTDTICLSKVFSQNLSTLCGFFLEEPLCQPHQDCDIIQSRAMTALFYRVSFAGIVLILSQGWARLTAVSASRSPVGCFVPFSPADLVPWKFIDPPPLLFDVLLF